MSKETRCTGAFSIAMGRECWAKVSHCVAIGLRAVAENEGDVAFSDGQATVLVRGDQVLLLPADGPQETVSDDPRVARVLRGALEVMREGLDEFLTKRDEGDEGDATRVSVLR
jgi:hypothetical protein